MIRDCETAKVAQDDAQIVIQKLYVMRLSNAAAKLDRASAETLTFYGPPVRTWRRILTHDPLERIVRGSSAGA